MINALSVDVEDYFHVTAFEKCLDRSQWDGCPLRVGDNTARILDLFDEYRVTATFFVLGWVARRLPALVREIWRRGHEVACHGYGHELVYVIGPERFREDIRLAKSLLEDIGGVPVRGYRAPSYSITGASQWALEILAEEGFSYDSSIFPIVHDIYGIPGALRFPHRITTPSGCLTEFPLSTFPARVMGREVRIPVSGGGYLRMLPVRLIAKAIAAINRRECQPTILYFHPWEIDPGQPRIRAGLRSRFRHYTNLSRMEEKLRALLGRFTYAPVSEVIAEGVIP